MLFLSGLAWVVLLFVVVGFACGFLGFLFGVFVVGFVVFDCCSWCLLWWNCCVNSVVIDTCSGVSFIDVWCLDCWNIVPVYSS